MKVIHVPDISYPSGKRSHMDYNERTKFENLTPEQIEADNQAYHDWKIHWESIIGFKVDPAKDYNSPLVGGFAPYDFVWVGKSLYKREPTETYGLKKLYKLYESPDEDAPDIMCDCGGFNFSLRYGSYEIKARCMNCGIEEVVYDG